MDIRSSIHTKRSNRALVNSHVLGALAKANNEREVKFCTSENVIRIQGLFGHSPLQNQLLAELPAEDFERLQPQLELASMPAGSVVCDVGMSMQFVYFPTSSVVSILHNTKEGGSAETAVIGSEGLVGLTTCMGGGKAVNRMVVKSGGFGFRMQTHAFITEFNRGGVLQNYLLRYTQALLTQMSQTAVCNRHHGVGQQLCRWLLLTIDRLPSPEVKMTQELIANMLGVRRESITEAAVKLQEERIIRYSRGHITVLDRPALETHACECYAEVKQEYDRLLPARA